jgi:hypothetical protein
MGSLNRGNGGARSAEANLGAGNLGRLIVKDPLDQLRSVLGDSRLANTVEGTREGVADVVKTSDDLLKGRVLGEPLLKSTGDELANGAERTTLGSLDGLDTLGSIGSAKLELGADDGGGLILKQKLDKSGSLRGNESQALHANKNFVRTAILTPNTQAVRDDRKAQLAAGMGRWERVKIEKFVVKHRRRTST